MKAFMKFACGSFHGTGDCFDGSKLKRPRKYPPRGDRSLHGRTSDYCILLWKLPLLPWKLPLLLWKLPPLPWKLLPTSMEGAFTSVRAVEASVEVMEASMRLYEQNNVEDLY